MTDEELIARLRDVYVENTIRLTAADRIEDIKAELVKTVAALEFIGSTTFGGQPSVMALYARETLAKITRGTK